MLEPSPGDFSPKLGKTATDDDLTITVRVVDMD